MRCGQPARTDGWVGSRRVDRNKRHWGRDSRASNNKPSYVCFGGQKTRFTAGLISKSERKIDTPSTIELRSFLSSPIQSSKYQRSTASNCWRFVSSRSDGGSTVTRSYSIPASGLLSNSSSVGDASAEYISCSLSYTKPNSERAGPVFSFA